MRKDKVDFWDFISPIKIPPAINFHENGSIVEYTIKDFGGRKIVEYDGKRYYSVSEYILVVLRSPKPSQEAVEYAFVSSKLLIPRRVYCIQPTNHVYCSTPLWTKRFEIWWFKILCEFIAFEVGPRLGSSISHYVSVNPVAIIDCSDDEFPKKAMEIFPYRAGACPYCGSDEYEETGHYDYSLFHRGEPDTPEFVCKNCGQTFFPDTGIDKLYENYNSKAYTLLKLCAVSRLSSKNEKDE